MRGAMTLHIRDVSKTYSSGVQALKDVTLDEQTIMVTVPYKPARAGIDPRNLLMDWELDDNIKTVRAKR
jgi:hypothetical protein